MKKFLLASAAAIPLLTAGYANAADLGRPTYKAPPPMVAPVPVFLWTGCYIGANIGGAWSDKSFHFNAEDEGSNTAGGFAGGGQVGCDYQFASSFVVGVQGMFDGTSISGTAVDPNNDGDSYNSKVHWFGTVTGRLGYLITPALLIYGKGGVAWVGENHTYLFDGVPSATTGDVSRTGWDAGVGLEWMFAPNWSVWVEYDHMGFGTKDLTFTYPDGDFFIEHVKQSVDKILVGVNWRFGLGKGKGPVVARY